MGWGGLGKCCWGRMHANSGKTVVLCLGDLTGKSGAGTPKPTSITRNRAAAGQPGARSARAARAVPRAAAPRCSAGVWVGEWVLGRMVHLVLESRHASWCTHAVVCGRESRRLRRARSGRRHRRKVQRRLLVVPGQTPVKGCPGGNVGPSHTWLHSCCCCHSVHVARAEASAKLKRSRRPSSPTERSASAGGTGTRGAAGACTPPEQRAGRRCEARCRGPQRGEAQKAT